ncbi:MAG: hypothetical protein HC865_12770 [Cyanobacteria bacterium RU_5_0]|nr:hypothetical protein [Cyanobacteria bacterium RU_5_0]
MKKSTRKFFVDFAISRGRPTCLPSMPDHVSALYARPTCLPSARVIQELPLHHAIHQQKIYRWEKVGLSLIPCSLPTTDAATLIASAIVKHSMDSITVNDGRYSICFSI